MKRDLQSPAAWDAFQSELRDELKAARPDPAHARKQLVKDQEEAANILAAIKAGIITATTQEALLAAEARQAEAKAELEAIERFEPSQISCPGRKTSTSSYQQPGEHRRCGCGP